MRVGVRPVHDHLDPARPRPLDDPLDREDLAGEVGDVTDVDDLRFRRDSALDPLGQVVLGRRGNGEGDLPDHDPLASLPLVPRREHARVVLRRREHLVPALERDPQLHGLERLARVARDRHLLGIAAEARREAAPHRLDLGFEDLPHRVRRRRVGVVEVAPHRLLHHARARAHAAVVQVDERAVEGERLLDLEPEVFVAGDVGERATGHAARQPAQPVEPVIREGRNRGPRGDQRLDEVAACRHGVHPPRSARRSSTP